MSIYHYPKSAVVKRLLLASCAIWLLLIPLGRYGKKHNAKDKKRGATLIREKALAKQLSYPRRLPGSDKLKIPFEYEPRHFLITGANGTGKSNLTKQVIEVLRNSRQKAIIYEGKGDNELLRTFYDSSSDYLFNPFDERSECFNVFDHIKSTPDFTKVASSIAPPSAFNHEKPFFPLAATQLIAAITMVCYLEGKRTNEAIWYALNDDPKQLHKKIKSLDPPSAAAIHLEILGEQYQGVVASAQQHAEFLKYMKKPAGKDWFSIKQWLDSGEGFLFISNNEQYRAALKPALTLLIDLLGMEILALEDDLQRRIFMFLTEFGTLHRLNTITGLFPRGRSKGLSLWLEIPEKSTIDAVYGAHEATTIINACNSAFIFRQNEPKSQDYFSRYLGEQISKEREKTVTTARDNKRQVSIRAVEKKERLVLSSELKRLPDMTYYLKLLQHPAIKTGMKYKPLPLKTAAFVENARFKADKITMDNPAVGNKRKRAQSKKSNGEKDAQILLSFGG